MVRFATLTVLLLVLAACASAHTANSEEKSCQSWFGGTNRSRISVAGSFRETPMQPLAQQVRRLEAALDLFGQPMDAELRAAIDKK
jgi:hypothetical protein